MRNQKPKAASQPNAVTETHGSFKYDNKLKNSRFGVLANQGNAPNTSKKRSNTDNGTEIKQPNVEVVKIRNPAAGRNKQNTQKNGVKGSTSVAKPVAKGAKSHNQGAININKENTSSSKEVKSPALEDQKLKAKERDAEILEYMRRMDASTQKDILNQIEQVFLPRVALKQLDSNTQKGGCADMQLGNERNPRFPLLGDVPMDTSGVVELQHSNQYQ